MKKINNIYNKLVEKKLYFLIFIILLTLLSSLNLFHKGIIFNHDTNFHLHRIIAVSNNISIGKILPVYFNYLNGFGYGNGLFYPDLFLYIPALIYNITTNIEISYKIFIIIINFFSLFNIFICVKRLSNQKYGLLAMILYSCSNYRMIDLVERGSIGEYMFFVFFPLIILGFYEIFYGNEKKIQYLIIGLCGLCYSHVISFYLTCIILIILTILNVKCLKNKKRLVCLIISIILSITITSHFWAPMIEQLLSQPLNIATIENASQYTIPFPMLFMDFPIIYLHEEWIPSGIGIIYYIGIFFYIKDLIKNKFIIKDKFLHTLFIVGITTIILSSFSLIWKFNIFYTIFKIIQFPWRFYMFSTTILIISLCMFFKNIKQSRIVKLALVYTVVIYITNCALYSFNVYGNEVGKDEIMLGEYLPQNFDRSIIDNFENNNIEYKRKNQILEITLNKNLYDVEVPLIYYKGYKACDNKRCYKTYKTDNGLVGIKLNNESIKLQIYYDGTLIYKITKHITFIGILLFITYMYFGKKKDECYEQKN